ncbi:MAG: oligosaccharide flippase family protein [Bacilli bacterium]|nr:oligosaccharide flippase family protein [Bacilli bacterium]
MEKKNTLFKNAIYKSILSLVNIVVPIIIGPYIARLLDVKLYGIYNTALANFQMFLAFASFGVYNFGVREISKIRNDKEKVSKLFTNLFVISLISNILVLLIYICFILLTSSGTAMTIYFILIIQILANVVYVEFVNEALENYKFITIKSVIVKIIYFVSLLAFVKKPSDVNLYAIIVSLTVFLNNIISFLYAKKKIKFNFSKIEFKKYLKPLLAVLIITNVDLLYSQLDKVMLGRYVSEVSVTLYFIPYYIVSTLVSIPYAIINVSIPRLSYIIKNESKEIYEEKLNNSISSLLFLIVPICFGLVAVAREVIVLYGGDKYISATIPLVIICIVRLFVSMESVMNNLVLYPNDKENRILKVSFVCGLINLILNYLLVLFKILSPVTAMITTGIAEIVMFSWHYIYTRNKMKINIKIFTKQNITYLVLGVLFIPISFIIKCINLSFIIKLGLIVVICSLLYFIVLYIKKDNNLMFILSKFKRKVLGE